MPTASTAQILGNNESIEPYTSNIYTRRVLSGEFQVRKQKSFSVFMSFMAFTARKDKVETTHLVTQFVRCLCQKAKSTKGNMYIVLYAVFYVLAVHLCIFNRHGGMCRILQKCCCFCLHKTFMSLRDGLQE